MRVQFSIETYASKCTRPREIFTAVCLHPHRETAMSPLAVMLVRSTIIFKSTPSSIFTTTGDMPKKKGSTETPVETVLVSAAKAIGTAARKVARLAGATPEPAKSQKIAKLSKKNKHKLPRREKKALQKSSK